MYWFKKTKRAPNPISSRFLWALVLWHFTVCDLVFSFETRYALSPLTGRSGRVTSPSVGRVLYSSSNDDTKKEDPIEDGQPNKKSLMELLSPASNCRVNQMSGTDLAYIGDVVFELFIRSRHVWPSKRTSDLQNRVVGIVRAEHQAHLLVRLKKEFSLSEKETQIVMRGRNAVTRSKNRRDPAAYQASTAFEALIGYLYISDPDRCQELLYWLDEVVDELA